MEEEKNETFTKAPPENETFQNSTYSLNPHEHNEEATELWIGEKRKEKITSAAATRHIIVEREYILLHTSRYINSAAEKKFWKLRDQRSCCLTRQKRKTQDNCGRNEDVFR